MRSATSFMAWHGQGIKVLPFGTPRAGSAENGKRTRDPQNMDMDEALML